MNFLKSLVIIIVISNINLSFAQGPLHGYTIIIDPGHRNTRWDWGAIGWGNICTSDNCPVFRSREYIRHVGTSAIHYPHYCNICEEIDLYTNGGQRIHCINHNNYRTAYNEAAIVLNIAHELAAICRENGAAVHLTRETNNENEYVVAPTNRESRRRRVELANNWDNDQDRHRTVFVSIHCNAAAYDLNGSGK